MDLPFGILLEYFDHIKLDEKSQLWDAPSMAKRSSSTAPYDPARYPRFAVTVDIVLFTIREGAIRIALVQKGEGPFQGQWALPGGFVREHENLDQAVVRELAEETGLEREDAWHLEQLGGYGDPKRDPRMRVVTIAYLAVCTDIEALKAGGYAAVAQLTALQAIKMGLLAFDHERIVRDALIRLQSKLEYTTLATMFLPPIFTIGDVREVYEAVWEVRLDKSNFQRNFRRNMACFVEYEGPPPPDRKRRPGRQPSQWWSLRVPHRPGEPIGLLDHALLGPREVLRRWQGLPADKRAGAAVGRRPTPQTPQHVRLQRGRQGY